jgi:hypothetical protein
MTTIDDCKILQFDKHNEDHRGNLTAIEGNITIPYEIKRVYYLYDVPGGESRAGHAHMELNAILIAVSGSFDVKIRDGKDAKTITLNRPNVGLLLREGIWRDIDNFSSGAVCLVLASALFLEEDYIRDYKQFKEWKSLQ